MADDKLSFSEYCRINNHLDALAEWDFTRNLPCTPDGVSFGSHKKVFWKCAAGHEWSATVKSRSQGHMCPVCLRRVVLPGVNDLAVTDPQLAAEWHPTRNGVLRPCDVLAGTQRKVWWQCAEGHEWCAEIGARVRGTGCPFCAGKQVLPGFNDLASLYPALSAEWSPDKNGPLTPDTVSPYSNKKVWWKCTLGHEWQASVTTRTSEGSGCPYCANKLLLKGFNDLAAVCPDTAKQWHPTLNGSLTPDMVMPGSHKRVWWQCDCGCEWRAYVFSRTGPGKCGCPACAGKYKRSPRQAAPLELYV